MNIQTIALASVLTIALAGCINPAESIPAEADVTFDGTGNGDQSDKASCDSEATVNGNGDIQDGVLTVTIHDDQGETVFMKSYEGSFATGDIPLSGHSGTWTMEAERSANDVIGDDFSGSYAFFLNCEGF